MAAPLWASVRQRTRQRQARRLALWTVESARAPLWLPVAFALGITVFFALPADPPAWSAWAWLGPAAVAVSGLWRRLGVLGAVLVFGLSFAGAGFAAGFWAVERAAAPTLGAPVAMTVEGRVIAVDRSASGAPRALLDRVVLYGAERGETPERIRISLLDAEGAEPTIGHRLRAYAQLFGPGGPVEPGAFDFARRAWFDRLGAVGYVRGPAFDLGPEVPRDALDRAWLWIAEARAEISAGLRRAMPGAEGAFAAAIIVGDRAHIAEADDEALRLSTLAHLLAISGLHMAILTGMVFAVVRLALAAVPVVSLGMDVRKVAAVAALLAGAGYLLMSGATVATQRAFVMVSVALVAVLLDRPAISIRALAVAALVILALRPATLFDVGFQMSFAATAALIAGYEAWRPGGPGRKAREEQGGFVRRVGRTVLIYALGVLFASVLAGLATAPFAAFHFNRAAPWGLLANLGAVPAMGLVIAPSAVAAGLLAPFGLEGPALAVMGAGIRHVLTVAHWVANLPGAGAPVGAAAPWVLAAVALGGAWLVVWRGPARWLGAGVVAAALVLWPGSAARPALIVAPDGGLIGVMTAEGRAIDRERGQSFAAETWLRRDGDPVDQETAAARLVRDRVTGGWEASFGDGWRVVVLKGRGAAGRVPEHCEAQTVVVLPRMSAEASGPCTLIDRDALSSHGAHAVSLDETGRPVVTVARETSDRAWHRRARPRW